MFELVHSTTPIDVLSIDAPETEHGLSMLDPVTGRIVIAVAVTSRPMRQRSSVAHELGHVLAEDLIGDTPLVPGIRSPKEIRADAFARHLLLPLAAIRQRFPDGDSLSLREFSAVVQEFEVSPGLAAIQLRESHRISPETCRDWSAYSSAHLATSFGWLSQYRALAAASTLPRAPQSLVSRAVEGYLRGVLSLAELAYWYGQAPETIEKELGSPQGCDEWVDDWDEDGPLFPEAAAKGALAL